MVRHWRLTPHSVRVGERSARRIKSLLLLALAALSLICLIHSCRLGESPVGSAVGTVQHGADDAGNGVS
jgi:hypothetical protein